MLLDHADTTMVHRPVDIQGVVLGGAGSVKGVLEAAADEPLTFVEMLG